ncbi:para-aminobenzoate synthase like protein [Zymoseptoria brevis]|uniref:aminodeoxychorismate synthase n=1 Tax=Zymoseptoria brevis TaxID=1047168 RepID=A0A0F4GP22_9PEZI|nr:para-aminobenzoate synthase like protein [Zymoseptoria brevis]
MPLHPILFIDAYDSFSNSIIALLEAELPVSVTSIKIDDSRFVLNDEAFFAYLHGFDAVVAGPGPGHPSNAQDIGLIAKLWTLPDELLLPVLGICLGFQSLCLAFGATVERLKEPRHGIMSMVTHRGKDIFVDTGKVVATQYHSLHVMIEADGKVPSFWESSEQCPELVPLAWDLMNVSNGPILMAVRHFEKPLWGVQYHPESICTNEQGQKLIGKWWEQVEMWRACHSKRPAQALNLTTANVNGSESLIDGEKANCQVAWRRLESARPIDVAGLVDALRGNNAGVEPLLLESGSRDGKQVNPETGRFSIIGLPDSTSEQIRYFTSTSVLEISSNGDIQSSKSANIDEAFSTLDAIVRENKASGGPEHIPFWGGPIGYVSYEAGLETIDVRPRGAHADRPDVWFVFTERSIVIDHKEQSVYVQSLRCTDSPWLDNTESTLQEHLNTKEDTPLPPITTDHPLTILHAPQKSTYCAKVRTCQSHLRAGSSYELCLTDQTALSTSSSSSAWSLYTRLRTRNPAPFAAYLHFQAPTTGPSLSVVSSSPERFLSWSRTGECQFRPIKGTVKKVPGMTRKKAEEILASPKERAENLMIVDLIRHDLSGVDGVTAVHVPKLMSVEEYTSVYQLVSVIEGTLSPPPGGPNSTSGISVLAASLPPGSMTGAPKKRSCELLQEIEEGKPRGLYAGVIGYLDVGGGGDFSVVIRTAYRWGVGRDDRARGEDEEEEEEEGGDDGVWKVGAGGAVTVLSEVEGEWEEMCGKRESVLSALTGGWLV